MVGECGPEGVGTEIQIEFDLSPDMDGEAVTITVCHDLKMSRTLWARHTIWDEVSASDQGNKRPSFSSDGFFDFDVNHYYSMVRRILNSFYSFFYNDLFAGNSEEDNSHTSRVTGTGR